MMPLTGTHDDAFCVALYEDYQNDPDKGKFVSIEEAAAALGVKLGE